jgi:hypothetical protein
VRTAIDLASSHFGEAGAKHGDGLLLCGSVQAVQKTARPAGGTCKNNRFLRFRSGWHARCIKEEKLNRWLTKMTGLLLLTDAAPGSGIWRRAPSLPAAKTKLK